MIYFVQEVDGNERYVKIGWVQDLEANRYDRKGLETRMHNLQVGNARYLKILAIIKGTQTDERMVQEKFFDMRVSTKGRGERDTERGEWFYPRQELMDLIAILPPYRADHGLTDEFGDEILKYIESLPRITREEQTGEKYRQMREDVDPRPIDKSGRRQVI
jgi:hypothetical protein